MKKLQNFLIVITLLLTLSLFADGPSQEECYSISANFTLLANDGMDSPISRLLKNNKWNIEYDSFSKSSGDIRTEINKMLPSNKSDVEAQLAKLKSGSKAERDMQMLRTVYYTNSAYNKILSIVKNKGKTNFKNVPTQHFGYSLGKKQIGGRNVYVIAFRGTTDIYTWILTNFMAFPTQFLNQPNITVHSGFEWYRQACMKQPKLKAFVKEIYEDNSNPLVILTGYSLGGAAAVLEGAYFSDKGIAGTGDINLITFAEPCPGSQEFCDKYLEKLTNYTWFVDIFDPAPLAPMLLGYNHFAYFTGLYLFNKGPKVSIKTPENAFLRHNFAYYYSFVNQLVNSKS